MGEMVAMYKRIVNRIKGWLAHEVLWGRLAHCLRRGLGVRAPPGSPAPVNSRSWLQIVFGATVEESTKSQSSVAAVIPLMLFMMITFLMTQLQSFNLLALV